MGSLHKLLAKVLTSRLKKVVVKVVQKYRNAFIKGRQILDAVLIANEVFDCIMKNDAHGILCKFDIKKVYSHTNYQFSILVKGHPLKLFLKLYRFEARVSFSLSLPIYSC